jgi:hypothetical protein
VEIATLAVALGLPWLLWHETIASIASMFRWQPAYLIAGWAPWALMVLGALCYLPVMHERLRGSRGRFHGSSRTAWYGWAISLYFLGFLLATQVAQIAGGANGL